MRLPAVLIALCMLAAALVAGCGSSGSDGDVPTPAEARAALRGSPPPLAAVHAQAAELLDGGAPAFRGRLEELKGYPVVVNVWAAWCGPCKEEFPVLQRASARYGGNVAFLGLDTEDVEKDARAWLDDHWISYPSYADPDGDLRKSIGVTVGIPSTVFIGRDGELAYTKQGPYRDDAAFERDLQRYLGAVPSS
ncbi:TlpA family protein disulfide reductase [Conexibacter arvalis]|uniref:Thiol-disulfide isomerase/thioredoxin n=1 Tax=Conexibacter arvalis TaxID=912552 RepID=A0A840IAL4_9ACTN|nr:TlpA disulfide reductase family protein [Conexibacter arvalis]MBB4661118.1 thiol-disulfide isomerase/thioredoxin [Conexibacter arvalis]